MEKKQYEFITSAGLRVSMPVPGIVRVTDGNHKKSWMVSAVSRPTLPKVSAEKLTWGKITVEPDNGMALSYEGRLLCRDYSGGRRPRSSISAEKAKQMKALLVRKATYSMNISSRNFLTCLLSPIS